MKLNQEIPLEALPFGKALARLRRRSGISQSQLAAHADFDHSYVSRLESGARMPARVAIDRLCASLTVTDWERNLLYAKAGFVSRVGGAVLYANLIELDTFLVDPEVAESQKLSMRLTIDSLVSLCHTIRPKGPTA